MSDVSRCEPPAHLQEEPYHWVQWRTPFRSDRPQPWTWDMTTQMWQTGTGSLFTPERAAALHWRYIGPAYPPELHEMNDLLLANWGVRPA